MGDGSARPAHAPRARVLPIGIVALAVGLNLVLLRGERLAVQPDNDLAVHRAMVEWARQRIEAGHNPFTGWFPLLQLGAAQFQHYQSLPYVVGGALATVFGTTTTVQWTLYLGLATWPVSVYLGMRLLDFEPAPAAGAALVAPLVVSVPPGGFELWSYVWSGNGLWPQMFAMWLLPITLGLGWRALRRGRGYLPAALLLGLTCVCHALVGYVAMLGIVLFALVERRTILVAGRRVLLLVLGALGMIAWFVIPLVVDADYATTSSAYNAVDQRDSYGARRVLGWLASGRLFDDGRLPIVTVLVALGLGVCISQFREDRRARALVVFFVANLVLFCGRPTFGPVLDVLPFSGDLQLERFVAGVHLGGIFLAGVGGAWLGARVADGVRSLRARNLLTAGFAVAGAAVVVAVLVAFAGWWQVGHLADDSTSGIAAQRAADTGQGADLQRLLDVAQATGPGRIYTGMRHGDGDSNRIGAAPLFLEVLDRGGDGIGLTLHTVSLMADVEPSFDDRELSQYQLLGVRYLIRPVGAPVPGFATPVATAGSLQLLTVPTPGYLSVTDTVGPPLGADRTTMNRAPADFLQSPLVTQGRTRAVAFAGAAAANPSNDSAIPPATPAGEVLAQHVSLDDAVFRARVRTTRAAFVLLRESYDPHWVATVDRKRGRPQMVAPAMVGVPVPAGTHVVEIRYRGFPDTWALWALSLLTVLVVGFAPGLWARRRARADS